MFSSVTAMEGNRVYQVGFACNSATYIQTRLTLAFAPFSDKEAREFLGGGLGAVMARPRTNMTASNAAHPKPTPMAAATSPAPVDKKSDIGTTLQLNQGQYIRTTPSFAQRPEHALAPLCAVI
jgi:hypothetical protein